MQYIMSSENVIDCIHPKGYHPGFPYTPNEVSYLGGETSIAS